MTYDGTRDLVFLQPTGNSDAVGSDGAVLFCLRTRRVSTHKQ